MTKHIYVLETTELGETYLLDFGWPMRQFRGSRGRASRLPCVALWTVRPVGWARFVALLVLPCQRRFWGALALPAGRG